IRRIMFVQRPAGGGSMTGLIDVIRALDRDRYEPVVLSYQRDTGYESTFRSLGATVETLGRPPKRARAKRTQGHEVPPRRPLLHAGKRLARFDIPTGRMIARAIRAGSIDLVHNHDNPRGDRPSILAARWAGVPQVCHVRYTPSYYAPLDRTLSRIVDRYLPVSEAVRSHMDENVGRLHAPVEILYDPFHFDVHDAAAATAQVDRRSLGLETGDYVLAHVGRIVDWKGQDVFLRAMRKTVDVCPNVKALVVGAPKATGPSQSFWRRLQSLATELDLGASVRFLGFRDDVPAILRASDCLVHTSIMPEPFGKVLVEAMASRRPVVSTDAGGPREIVEEGRTGVLVPTADEDALAAALIDLARSPARAREMGERARSVAEARYGVAAFREALTRIYETVLGEPTS
ncbi:MAG: glycosyltransferase, partial [Gemmatimonadetes bacterium]|nr:glycosyltransferase [Gemmatimonadota bacterium]